MDEPKVTVITKDGSADVTIRQGPDYVVLEDLTQQQFKTKDPFSFVEYVNNLKDNERFSGLPVFATVDDITLFPKEIDHYSVPVAELKMEEHSIISALREFKSATFQVSAFKPLLKRILKFGNVDAAALYEFVSKSVIKAQMELRRMQDEQGNFEEFISKKVGERLIPDRIGFQVPILRNFQDEALFVFDVALSYSVDGALNLTFTTSNFFFEDEVRDAKVIAIEKLLGEIKDRKVYYGTIEKVPRDDKWKYVSVSL